MLATGLRHRCSLQAGFCRMPSRRARCRRRLATNCMAAANAAVIGGGLSGLGAATALLQAGVNVTLVEQGRGLGGRVCSRRANISGATVYFDHGAQYLTAKPPAFAALLPRLEAAGVAARWTAAIVSADASASTAAVVGDVPLSPDGATFDFSGFKRYDPTTKALYVGVPSMSAVGRHLADAAAESATGGAALHVVRGTRAAALRRVTGSSSSRGLWQLELEGRAAPAGADGDAMAAAREKAASTEFDFVVPAMSANSTRRLLDVVCPAAAEAAAQIKANVCWSVMVALARPTGLPFDGALITQPPPPATPSPIAWLARDSSKPGRAALLPPGCAETWVLHGSPEWSNARANAPRDEVARELLSALLAASPAFRGQTFDFDRDVLYLEAHAWTNAYPLNPRAPVVVPGLPDVAGAFVLDAAAGIVSCGDWCLGPRAGDAWVSGQEAAAAALKLL